MQVKQTRSAKAFRTNKERNRYFVLLFTFIVLGIAAGAGLIFYNNPVDPSSSSFAPIVKRRVTSLIAIAIAAVCHSLSTVSFQTVTGNRIITPSLLGFEYVYSFINTLAMFLFGISAFQSFQGVDSFLFQMIVMVLVCLVLYGTLLLGAEANVHFMLLVGIVMGSGLQSMSIFLRRLLSPAEFDVLQTHLFASVNNADPDYFPIAIPLILIAAVLLFINTKRLNAISLGRDVAVSVGVNCRRQIIFVLIMVSILMSVSTALIGPLTFYGFLIAALTYQLVPTYDHSYLFPMALALGFFILAGAYFLMDHVFSAQGVVSIIIEIVGGLVFLIVILRKGSL